MNKVIHLAILLLLIFSTAAWAETTVEEGKSARVSKETEKNQKIPVIITSNNLVAETKHNRATFTGDVKAVKGDVVFYANKMVVLYAGEHGKIKKIIATGNIKLIKESNTITSDRAEYFAKEEKVIFLGNPKAIDGKNIITGTKMIYFLNDERSIIENSRVHLANE